MAFLDYFRNMKNKHKQVVTVNEIDALPTFSDEDAGLYWNRITSENIADNEMYFQEMSEWSADAGVRRYIASKVSIDKIFRECVKSAEVQELKTKNNLYFCFNDNADFVGFAYISAPFGENKHSTLEYIVVNPKFQRSGFGTKMVKSISSYMDYFNNGYESSGLMSSVEVENIASSRAFLKNNFKVVSANTSDTGRRYNVFYLSSRNNAMDENNVAG